MINNISNLGKVLNKSEQQSINGGAATCTLQCTWRLDLIRCRCISYNDN